MTATNDPFAMLHEANRNRPRGCPRLPIPPIDDWIAAKGDPARVQQTADAFRKKLAEFEADFARWKREVGIEP